MLWKMGPLFGFVPPPPPPLLEPGPGVWLFGPGGVVPPRCDPPPPPPLLRFWRIAASSARWMSSIALE